MLVRRLEKKNKEEEEQLQVIQEYPRLRQEERKLENTVVVRKKEKKAIKNQSIMRKHKKSVIKKERIMNLSA